MATGASGPFEESLAGALSVSAAVVGVALGALFWRSFAAGDAVSQGAAILIAGLVIRYGVSYRMLAPPFRNIHCYVKYGLLMLQRKIPQWVDDKCRAEVI